MFHEGSCLIHKLQFWKLDCYGQITLCTVHENRIIHPQHLKEMKCIKSQQIVNQNVQTCFVPQSGKSLQEHTTLFPDSTFCSHSLSLLKFPSSLLLPSKSNISFKLLQLAFSANLTFLECSFHNSYSNQSLQYNTQFDSFLCS